MNWVIILVIIDLIGINDFNVLVNDQNIEKQYCPIAL